MTRTSLSRVTIFSLLLTVPLLLPAQSIQSGLAPTLPSASAAAYYYIAKPGELTMQINVWGFVQKPGRYEVASSTDLIQLISLAGGPAEYANMDEVRISRLQSSDETLMWTDFLVNLTDLEKLGKQDVTLRPGDTIVVDHTMWLTIRDLFSVITTAAIITTAITQIIAVSK